MSVLVETTVGDFVIDLFVKERETATKNFLKLCKFKYYNLCQFFTIQKDYIAQTGDPTSTGRGGDSFYTHLYGNQARFFVDESPVKIKHRRKGTVSFVNNGHDMFASQFFITLADDLDYLDGKHCVFGIINEGMDTVDALNETLVNEFNQPFKDIRISHTIVLHDPFTDPPNIRYPSRSPSPGYELIEMSNKIALDQDIHEDAGKTAEEIQREIEDRDLKTHAQILEMVGDIHDIDEKPPDNVLFVCKLNPATTDEDLQMIFSQCGEVKECEIIRDRRTKASLQYAFIEFATPEQCERAYLKMDNVLIDDRRIHVDFSQSVAKNYQWKRKGNQGDGDRSPRDSRAPRPRHRTRSPSPKRRRSRERRSRSREHKKRDRKRSRSREKKHRRSRSREHKRRDRSREKRSRRSRS